MITIPKFIVIKVAHKLNRHHKILQINHYRMFSCPSLSFGLPSSQRKSPSYISDPWRNFQTSKYLQVSHDHSKASLDTYGAIFSKLSLWFLLNANIILTFQTFSTGRLLNIYRLNINPGNLVWTLTLQSAPSSTGVKHVLVLLSQIRPSSQFALNP